MLLGLWEGALNIAADIKNSRRKCQFKKSKKPRSSTGVTQFCPRTEPCHRVLLSAVPGICKTNMK